MAIPPASREIFEPVTLPRTTYCLRILATILGRLKNKPHRSADNGEVFESLSLNAYASGMESVITDPFDGQSYRISVEPIEESEAEAIRKFNTEMESAA